VLCGGLTDGAIGSVGADASAGPGMRTDTGEPAVRLAL
jgi:hypothetical protein